MARRANCTRAILGTAALATFAIYFVRDFPRDYFDCYAYSTRDFGCTPQKGYLAAVKGRPNKVCGLSGPIAVRIADCTARNGARAAWEGAKDGQPGEGTWNLVTLYSTAPDVSAGADCPTGPGAGCFELWQDQLTRIVWTDVMTRGRGYADWSGGYNWFQASGYSAKEWAATSSGYDSRPGKGEDCQNPAGGADVPCQPEPPLNVCADASQERPSKGGANGPVRAWRLPTRDDFEQAEADGMQKVLPNMNHSFWAESSDAYSVYNAWVFSGDGYIYAFNRGSTDGAVRCVGRDFTLE